MSKKVLIRFCQTCYSDQERYGDGKCKRCVSNRCKLRYLKLQLNTNPCEVGGCEKAAIRSKHCAAHYHRLQRYGDPLGVPTSSKGSPISKPCKVQSCVRKATTRQLCPAHYQRWRTTGEIHPEIPIIDGTGVLSPRRYMKTTRHGHPLSDSMGRIGVHRLTLYDAIGLGLHQCYWCNKTIEWMYNSQQSDKWHSALVVDHLNFDKHDNRLANLVPACNPCNSTRWRIKQVV